MCQSNLAVWHSLPWPKTTSSTDLRIILLTTLSWTLWWCRQLTNWCLVYLIKSTICLNVNVEIKELSGLRKTNIREQRNISVARWLFSSVVYAYYAAQRTYLRTQRVQNYGVSLSSFSRSQVQDRDRCFYYQALLAIRCVVGTNMDACKSKIGIGWNPCPIPSLHV